MAYQWWDSVKATFGDQAAQGRQKQSVDQWYADNPQNKRQDFGEWAQNAWRDIKGGVNEFMGTGPRNIDERQVDASAGQMGRSDWWQQTLGQGAQDAAGRGAPLWRGATLNGDQQAQFRAQQSELANMLMAQARGQGPSLAQGQLQQATDRNMAQALAMAQATNPNGGGAGLRNLANQRAAIGQQAASDSALLRMQEQMAAQNMLGQVASGARGQDIGFAVEQAGLQQQTGLANQQARLQQQAQNDALVKFYTSMGMSLDEANRQAAIEMEKLKAQTGVAYEGMRHGQPALGPQLLGAAGSALGFLSSSGEGGDGASYDPFYSDDYTYGSPSRLGDDDDK